MGDIVQRIPSQGIGLRLRRLRNASPALALGTCASLMALACSATGPTGFGDTNGGTTSGTGSDPSSSNSGSSGSGSSGSGSSSSGPSSATDGGVSKPVDGGANRTGVDGASSQTADASTNRTADAGSTNRGIDASAPGADAGSPGIVDAGVLGPDAGYPTGWLYTSGAKIYVSNGSSGTPWMGRGVNMDDIFFCGYNNTLWMTTPDQTLKTVISGLMSAWKPNFVRISLAMDSDATMASWLSNPTQYKTPMTNVINALGANPNVHVLVTLRSDVTMIHLDTGGSDPEATGVPSDSTNTPNAALYPTGTDAVYVALVDTFASASFVMFGLTNEPGGNAPLSNSALAAAMNHAVGTIRAEENRLGVPHHIVSVQGNGWASDVSFYAATPKPITYDNVVYEIHGYPPPASSYTYSNIPVILGEYGTLANATTFFADIEAKQIPSLAWDFEAFSDCAPDLLNATTSATNLSASTWGSTVQGYLLAHAL